MEKFEDRESVVLENEGQKIFGILHRPKTKGPHPCVLICHGLAGTKVGLYRLYVTLSEKLSRLGIASFRIDFRGSGDSEGDFSEMTIEGEVSDANLALNYLKNQSDINKHQIGIFGRSIGGAIALLAAKNEGSIKSLCTWAPIFNGDQWLPLWHLLHKKQVTEEFRQEKMRINGQVPGNEFFRQLFSLDINEALIHLNHIPLLHIHGDLDTVVNPEHADFYKKSRMLATVENRFLRLPKSDHDFTDLNEQKIALETTAQWFKDTLTQTL